MAEIKNPKRVFNQRFEKLAGLEAEEDVYEFLAARRIKGQRWNDERCPIANYLSKGITDFPVNVGTIAIGYCNISRTTPTVLENFINGFDNGNYPDLEIKEIKYAGV